MERIVKGIWFPIEIWEAEDLTWKEKILLMEVDSFTSQGRDCYISDEHIAEVLKVDITYANKILSSLIKKGYIKKVRSDGRKRYIETCLRLAKKCKSGLQKSASQTCKKVQHTNNNILIDNSSKKNISDKENFNFKSSLIKDLGVSEEVATAWMVVRKNKRATNSEIAFRKVAREIAKSGRSADECIRVAVENSWSGFEYEWLMNREKTVQHSKVSAFEQNMKVAEILFGKGGEQ